MSRTRKDTPQHQRKQGWLAGMPKSFRQAMNRIRRRVLNRQTDASVEEHSVDKPERVANATHWLDWKLPEPPKERT